MLTLALKAFVPAVVVGYELCCALLCSAVLCRGDGRMAWHGRSWGWKRWVRLRARYPILSNGSRLAPTHGKSIFTMLCILCLYHITPSQSLDVKALGFPIRRPRIWGHGQKVL
ncbi:hypothetical protein ACMFMG_005935 [Clarireedia jacksonii]